MNDLSECGIQGSHAAPEVKRTAEELLPILYAELHGLARRAHRSMGGAGTLQTTALVHEAYLRLRQVPAFADRDHFLRAAALAMRHALINHVRDRGAIKRGGGATHVPLDEADVAASDNEAYVLAVHEALQRLGELDERLEHIVECRFFAGYSSEETARALAIHERTVHRGWARAKAWLRQELGDFAG